MNDAILNGLSWCKWARSCILTSHVIKRLHIWQVKLRISDRWCHSQSMQRAFPVRAMVITSSEICMNFAVKIVFLLCFGALVRSDYWQVWTTRPKPQWTRLWRSDVELFEHCFNILRKDNCKPRRETVTFWYSVWLILETWQYPVLAAYHGDWVQQHFWNITNELACMFRSS